MSLHRGAGGARGPRRGPRTKGRGIEEAGLAGPGLGLRWARRAGEARGVRKTNKNRAGVASAVQTSRQGVARALPLYGTIRAARGAAGRRQHAPYGAALLQARPGGRRGPWRGPLGGGLGPCVAPAQCLRVCARPGMGHGAASPPSALAQFSNPPWLVRNAAASVSVGLAAACVGVQFARTVSRMGRCNAASGNARRGAVCLSA